MNNRSYALGMNSFFYSTLTTIFIIAGILRLDLNMLYWACMFLFITTLNVLLAIIIDQQDNNPDRFILAISFALLIPMGIIIFTVTFITTFISELFKRGGDNDD